MHTIYDEFKNPSALATYFQLHTKIYIYRLIKKWKCAIIFFLQIWEWSERINNLTHIHTQICKGE